MPLFFFVSGMLYRPRQRYALHQARTLMWPYFVFALLSFLYWSLLEVRFRPVPAGTSVAEQFVNIFYPMNMLPQAHEMNVVLWFLPALFFCTLFYHYGVRRLGGCWGQLSAAAVVAVCLQFADVRIPFFIPQALEALPFYVLGRWLNDGIVRMGTMGLKARVPLSVLALLLFAALWLYPTGGGMRGSDYPYGYLAYLLVAVLCILSLCMLCPRRWLRPLAFFGANSLAVMLVHEPLKRIVIKAYSVVISMDMEAVRASALHSLAVTLLVFLVLWPVVLLLRRYGSKLLRI